MGTNIKQLGYNLTVVTLIGLQIRITVIISNKTSRFVLAYFIKWHMDWYRRTLTGRYLIWLRLSLFVVSLRSGIDTAAMDVGFVRRRAEPAKSYTGAGRCGILSWMLCARRVRSLSRLAPTFQEKSYYSLLSIPQFHSGWKLAWSAILSVVSSLKFFSSLTLLSSNASWSLTARFIRSTMYQQSRLYTAFLSRLPNISIFILQFKNTSLQHHVNVKEQKWL